LHWEKAGESRHRSNHQTLMTQGVGVSRNLADPIERAVHGGAAWVFAGAKALGNDELSASRHAARKRGAQCQCHRDPFEPCHKICLPAMS
jgi:hypothetical protein